MLGIAQQVVTHFGSSITSSVRPNAPVCMCVPVARLLLNVKDSITDEVLPDAISDLARQTEEGRVYGIALKSRHLSANVWREYYDAGLGGLSQKGRLKLTLSFSKRPDLQFLQRYGLWYVKCLRLLARLYRFLTMLRELLGVFTASAVASEAAVACPPTASSS